MASKENAQPELLTVRDAARRYSCHPDTIRKLLREGDLPETRLGAQGRIRIPRRQADRKFGIEEGG
jgi:excisionase family DNA binding protein